MLHLKNCFDSQLDLFYIIQDIKYLTERCIRHGHVFFQEILTQLRTIFDLVIEFQAAQDNFYSEATQELDYRHHYKHMQEQRSKEVNLILSPFYLNKLDFLYKKYRFIRYTIKTYSVFKNSILWLLVYIILCYLYILR